MQTTIQTLFKRGYSKARISRELGVNPKTIRKVLRNMENGETEIQKKPHPSMLDKHREFIEIFYNRDRLHSSNDYVPLSLKREAA